jgi:hypothetical protein
MAALVLALAGAQFGGLFGPVGAIAGRLAGALIGNAIDQAMFTKPQHREGPRLANLEVTGSTEGAPIPRLYGRARLGGQVIWATRLEEVIEKRKEKTGGKGFGPKVTTTTYSYFANIAVGLCEGNIARVARVWADGKPLDLDGVTMRVYSGTETQAPDALIVSKDGAGNAPAFRGLAYVVFERLPLKDFGNRIPQFAFEVIRPVGDLETMVRAVTLIPGASEFGYAPAPLTRTLEPGVSAPENRHMAHAPSDWTAALDDLQALCPNLERVALVVSWFGTDLRAGQCLIRPQVERADKTLTGDDTMKTWSVAGLTRTTAAVVSQVGGSPAYGGTPSDRTVVAAIRDLKARGLKVTFYPFVMMDVPADNALPDPWTGGPSQPAYPWRGQITCDPAPGRAGSPDGTAAAATQVNALFGVSLASHTALAGDDVVYSGPQEWTLRRMAFHYARLCQAAGGVDAFVIGSEFAALTRVRAGSSTYPATAQWQAIAAGVRAILGPTTKITYAADWTEYGSHVPDGGATVRFPLDPLWADVNIDMVGIDYYAPLADWRDGDVHLDRALSASIYDRAYLSGNLRRGEAYDWSYSNDTARINQSRTPISDGLGKPWIFRAKDIWSWWSNNHRERTAAVEHTNSTAWVPQSKPIWFTEFGCGAVDKGANRPSVFPDPKSSVGGLPPFSNGARDDLMQRRALEAVLSTFDPLLGATSATNPVSATYGGRMLDPSALHVWTWDARPYPAFPAAADIWNDGANWRTGHWLNGRLGTAPLDGLVRAILTDHAVPDFDVGALTAPLDGYVLDKPMSARAALEPLASAFQFDGQARGDTLILRPRGGAATQELAEQDLVDVAERPLATLTRAQETELPRAVTLSFVDETRDYRASAVSSRRIVGGSARELAADLPAILSDAEAERRAEIFLQDIWAGREEAQFALPPSFLSLEPGDVIDLTTGGRRHLLEVGQIIDDTARRVTARSIDPTVFTHAPRTERPRIASIPAARGPANVIALDLPRLPTDTTDILQRLAVFARPWPAAMAVWRAIGTDSFERVTVLDAPSLIGTTLDPLPAGPVGRWDHASHVTVKLVAGALESASDLRVLAGANALAVQAVDGAWEVIQFTRSDLIGPRTYVLSRLLRGQAGSEQAMAHPLPAGAPVVVLDAQIVSVSDRIDDIGRTATWRVVAADRDHADASRVEITTIIGKTALMPLAPVHLKATRETSGIRLTWLRRSRIGADSLEAVDIPLGEDLELYEIEILDGLTVKRMLTSTTQSVLYPAASEVVDFGGSQVTLTIRVTQMSARVGRGHPAIATLSL